MKGFTIAILIFSVSFSVVASDPDLSRHLTRIEQLLSEYKYDEASDLARALVPDNDEQTALHQRLLGYIYLQELDYDRAYIAYSNALKYRKLSLSLRQDVLGALVSLSMKREKPEVTIYYGRMYLDEFSLSQPVEQLYMRALFAETQYVPALKQANAIIARYVNVPAFVWQIKALSEEQLYQHRALINTTRILQQHFGDDIRWHRKQAAAYAYLGETPHALTLLTQAIEKGLVLTGQDYINMANYAAQLQHPEQAISILSQAVDLAILQNDRETKTHRLHYQIRASHWLDAWETVTDLNRKPTLPLLKTQCRIASELQRWPEAVSLAQQAIKMGGDRDPFLWEILGYSAMKAGLVGLSRSAYESLKQLKSEGGFDG